MPFPQWAAAMRRFNSTAMASNLAYVPPPPPCADCPRQPPPVPPLHCRLAMSAFEQLAPNATVSAWSDGLHHAMPIGSASIAAATTTTIISLPPLPLPLPLPPRQRCHAVPTAVGATVVTIVATNRPVR